jgi:hypothetical protein
VEVEAGQVLMVVVEGESGSYVIWGFRSSRADGDGVDVDVASVDPVGGTL